MRLLPWKFGFHLLAANTYIYILYRLDTFIHLYIYILIRYIYKFINIYFNLTCFILQFKRQTGSSTCKTVKRNVFYITILKLNCSFITPYLAHITYLYIYVQIYISIYVYARFGVYMCATDISMYIQIDRPVDV